MLCSPAASSFSIFPTSLPAAFLLSYPPVTLRRVVHRHACRRLQCADLEDCTLEFAEHMLSQYGGELERRRDGPRFEAWLDRCARNHVEDFCRRLSRRRRRETAFPEQEDESGASAQWEPASSDASCDAVVLSGECGDCIRQAVRRLDPLVRDLFVRHYMHGETLTELAQATGNTPDGVRMILSRARKQVRATLERQGMTEGDADDYLAVIRRGGGGGQVEGGCAERGGVR